jgi:3-hydroxyisobutyrate dehydrogenase-like beta-hydroxyacid dehydrogenase
MAVMSSPSPFPQVAFIGLGAMGFAMSTHLVRTGFPVTGYDIYGPTLERWQSTCDNDIPNSRATNATSPKEAVQNAPVVCLMVANHHHVHSALFDDKVGAVHTLPKDCTVIIHATIPPTEPLAVRARMTDEFKRPDVKLIDAPVSGGAARSINGTLTIMAASDNPKYLEQPHVKAVLENVASKGKTLFVIPGTLGAGQSAKALNQVMAGIHIPAASEIMGLAALNGVDTQKFYDALTSQDSFLSKGGKLPLGWSWMFDNRGPRMLSATPPMASATAIINKDVGIIRDEEVRLNTNLPLLNQAGDVIKAVMQTHASADDSCIVQYYLGFDSDRASLVVQRAGNPTIASGTDEEAMIRKLATAHAVIHVISAFETITFAKSLDLMRPEQRKQWFSLIAGAAGGTTVFAEVIPRAFEDPDNVEAAFKKYAKEKFSNLLDDTVSRFGRDFF